MASGRALKAADPFRGMVVGYPGSGKTGALAALANAGYKLRILDFDGNLTSLLSNVDDRALDNIDAVLLEDKLAYSSDGIKAEGIPEAFAKAFSLMDEWKYKDADGNEVNLGRSRDWGMDTIVVLDSLTKMGNAGKRRAMNKMNKTPANMTDGVWGMAMADQEAFIERLASKKNRHHVIILSHLKMIAPKAPRKDFKQDEEVASKMNEVFLETADLIPTRLFPSALGQQLPPLIGGHLPIMIEAFSEVRGGKVVRKLRTQPREALDLKVPARGLPVELPLESGMLTIFEALGLKSPGF